MLKTVSKIGGTVVVILGVLAVAMMLLVSSSFFNLVHFRYVSTGSMEPKIKVASLVLIAKTDVAKLNKGDIINFLPAGSAVSITHRIADIKTVDNQISFITKGDANNIADIDPVPAQNVLGKVVLSIPYLGYFYTWIKTPVGFVVAVILPALYILISEFLAIKKTIEDHAIEKFKKLNKDKKIIVPILIFFLLGVSGLKKAAPTVSYFSSGKVLANNSFSTGVWAPSPTPTMTPTPTLTPTPTPTPGNDDEELCRRFDHFWDDDFDFKEMKKRMKDFMPQYFRRFGRDDHSDYEFIYSSRGIKKGIYGKMTDDFDADRNFFPGTCTTETCNPDTDLGPTAEINLEGHFCNRDFHWKKTIRDFR